MIRNLTALSLFIGSLSALAAVTPAPKPGRSFDFTNAQAKVEFLAVGKPSMLKIRGDAKPEGDKKPLEGALMVTGTNVEGKASLELNTLDTGIALRNRHMKEKYLETAKFPKADFTLTECNLPESLKSGTGEANGVAFKGTLKIHGVEKPVAGTVDIKLADGKADFAFKFQTKIPDYAIATPSFLGVTVAEDVEVTVGLQGPLT